MLSHNKKDGASACVTIQNVPQIVYFLPRDGCDFREVFAEVEDIFEKKRIKKFKSRSAKKKNFFAGGGVPTEAEYLRVEYGAEYPVLEKTLKGYTLPFFWKKKYLKKWPKNIQKIFKKWPKMAKKWSKS